MNLVLLQPGQTRDGREYELGERHATHARKIWKSRPGDTVRVGLLGGNRGTARISGLDHHRLRLEVVSLEVPPPPPLAVDLALALPRPPILRRCLQQATTLGVKRIVLFDCARVERSFWSSGQLEPGALHEQLVLGLEQAGDTVLPEVERVRPFRRFLERLGDGAVVVADPEGEAPAMFGPAGPAMAVIGPEGGFLPAEIKALRAHDATVVGLGPRLLRVDTACVALLARLAVATNLDPKKTHR